MAWVVKVGGMGGVGRKGWWEGGLQGLVGMVGWVVRWDFDRQVREWGRERGAC